MDSRIKELEAILRCELPRDYADFLLSDVPGKPLIDDEDTNLFCYFPIGDLSLKKFKMTHPDDYVNMPVHCARRLVDCKTMLPIATDAHFNFLCLDISKENFGNVVLYDHDADEYVELVDTFTEFLENPVI